MVNGRFRGEVILLALLLFARPASAIVLGQFDTFQDGSTENWTNGGPAPPIMNNGGGPGGPNDRYIQVTADGSGAGGRLTIFNFSQWSGDYISAGVTTIEIDLLNQSAVNLSIRLAFRIDTFQIAPGYLSPPMLLPVGSGWMHFSMPITAANLIPVGGPSDYNTFFSGIGEMRIIHEVGTGNLNGDPVVGQLGIDNIHAIPEPSITALASIGLLALTAQFARVKRRSIR